MKSQKGLTFIATIFLVLLIAFIVFGVVYFINLTAEKESLESLKTDLLSVQNKVKKISNDYILDKKEENLIGTKLEDKKEEEPIKEFLEQELFDSEDEDKKYYVLDQESLNNLELGQIKLKEDAYYVVEYTEKEVYYTQGFKGTDGKTYYKLEDIENIELEEPDKQENQEENKNQESNESQENNDNEEEKNEE